MMNPFEAIYRTTPQLFEALNHIREKQQRLPSLKGLNIQHYTSRWSQVNGLTHLQHRLTCFNIFTALNAMDYETRHSNFLAWLFDPTGTHGFGIKYLYGFLSLIAKKMGDADKKALFGIIDSPTSVINATVFREFKRADLLVVDENHKFVCLIENKIHTGEHSEQLTRYRQMVQQEFPGYHHVFIFLTLRSEVPSDTAYVSLTYAEMCGELKRLNEAIETKQPAEVLAFLLHQYVSFIEGFDTKANPHPNVFAALRLREIKHSDFFAWLFDPRETHNLGIKPFTDFLQLVRQKMPRLKIPELDIVNDWEISRELYNIDILVVSEQAKFVCLIEHKLEAREGKDQLQRYKAFVCQWFPGFDMALIFLTLRGDKPTDSDYVSLRFADFTPYLRRILKSLPECEWSDGEIVSTLLDHYRTLLSDRLSLRYKTRVELAPEVGTSCSSVFQQESSLAPLILAGVREWQESVREEMELFLGELITRAFGKDCFRPSPFRRPFDVYLPFVPRELDAIVPLANGGADPAYEGQLFDFVFLNLPFTNPFKNEEPLGITLRAGMKAAKPGYHGLREIIYGLAKGNRALFNSADNEHVGQQKNCMVLSQTLCRADDFRKCELSVIKAKVQVRFDRFTKHQYPEIMKTLRHQSVATYKPISK